MIDDLTDMILFHYFRVCIVLLFFVAMVKSETILSSYMPASAFECTAKEAGGMFFSHFLYVLHYCMFYTILVLPPGC